MVRKKKIIIDEHEMIEEMPPKNKHSKFVFSSFVIATASLIVFSVITFDYIQKQKEKRRIDEIVISIQNDIHEKQCMLDKIYCCEYKDNESCEKWKSDACVETNGTGDMDCSIKIK